MKRNCDYCGKEYKTDQRNINRGWGLCCSKSCAASKREKSKQNYNSSLNQSTGIYLIDKYKSKHGFVVSNPKYKSDQQIADEIDIEQAQLNFGGSWDDHDYYVERCEYCGYLQCRCD